MMRMLPRRLAVKPPSVSRKLNPNIPTTLIHPTKATLSSPKLVYLTERKISTLLHSFPTRHKARTNSAIFLQISPLHFYCSAENNQEAEIAKKSTSANIYRDSTISEKKKNNTKQTVEIALSRLISASNECKLLVQPAQDYIPSNPETSKFMQNLLNFSTKHIEINIQMIRAKIESYLQEKDIHTKQRGKDSIHFLIKDLMSRSSVLLDQIKNITLRDTVRENVVRLLRDTHENLNEILIAINGHLNMPEVKCIFDPYLSQTHLKEEKRVYDAFLKTLENIKEFYLEKNGYTPRTCFISYAWPNTDQESPLKIKPDESWTQAFLKQLRNDLRTAGITAYLDIMDNEFGGNIYQFMEKASTSSITLLIGSQSLLEKHKQGVSAVCTELINIKRKRVQDIKLGVVPSVYPILISGETEKSFPAAYELYSTIRDWQNKPYYDNLRELFQSIYQAGKDNGDYNNLWIAFDNELKKDTFEPSNSDKKIAFNSITQSFKQKLKASYKSQKVSRLFKSTVGEGVPLIEAYTQLELVTETPKSYPKQQAANSPTSLFDQTEKFISIKGRDIFKKKSENSSNIGHILIEGSAGIGKTTFCRYLALQWSLSSPWLTIFDWCILISLRDLWHKLQNVKHFDPELILQPLLDKNNPEQIHALMDQIHHQKTLFLIDGYDEIIPHQNHPILEQCLQYLFKQQYVVLTSRQSQIDFTFTVDRHLRIEGFVREHAFNYMENYFSHNLDKAKQLKSITVNDLTFRPIITTPILLEVLCELCERDIVISAITVKSDLYYRLLTELVRWNLSKEAYPQSLHLSEKDLLYTQKYMPAIECLQELAYHSFVNSQHIISSELLKSSYPRNSLPVLQVALQKLGFTRPLIRDDRFFENEFYFIHLTFQEYLTARHWIKLFTSKIATDNKQACELLIENKHNPRYQVIWPFVAGILDKEYDVSLLNSYFQHLIEEPHDLTGVFETILIIRCLYEVKFQGKISIEKKFIEELKKYIKIHIIKEGEINPLIRVFITKLKDYPSTLMALDILNVLSQAIHHNNLAISLTAIKLLLLINQDTLSAIDTMWKILHKGNITSKLYILSDVQNNISLYLTHFDRHEFITYLAGILEQQSMYSWRRTPSTLKLIASLILLQLKQENNFIIDNLIGSLQHWSIEVRRIALRGIEEAQINHPKIIQALRTYNHIIPTLIRLPLWILPQNLVGFIYGGYLLTLYFQPSDYKLLAAKVLLTISPKDPIGEKIFELAKRSWIRPVRLYAAAQYATIIENNTLWDGKRKIFFAQQSHNEEYINYIVKKIIGYLHATGTWMAVPPNITEIVIANEPLEALVKAYVEYTKGSPGIWTCLLISNIVKKSVEYSTPLIFYNNQFHYFYHGKIRKELNTIPDSKNDDKKNELNKSIGEFRSYFFQPSSEYHKNYPLPSNNEGNMTSSEIHSGSARKSSPPINN